jgi:NAD(P)H dehydrogenase (quinone)
MQIVIAYHSGSGHTKQQAEAVLKGVQNVSGAVAHLVNVEEIDKHWTVLDGADAIIFGAPTYMGSVSGPMKIFMDATSSRWFEQKWKNKFAAGFTNSGGPSGDKLSTLIQFVLLAAQHSMIWINQGLMPNGPDPKTPGKVINRLSSFLGAMSQSPHGAKGPVEEDLRTAELFGQHVAQTVAKLSLTPVR